MEHAYVRQALFEGYEYMQICLNIKIHFYSLITSGSIRLILNFSLIFSPFDVDPDCFASNVCAGGSGLHHDSPPIWGAPQPDPHALDVRPADHLLQVCTLSLPVALTGTSSMIHQWWPKRAQFSQN